MKLPPEQQERVLETLQNVWQQQCSSCGQKKWILNDKVFELREYNKGDIVGGAAIIPLMVGSCAGCGNTIFFNAIALDIIDPQTGDLKP